MRYFLAEDSGAVTTDFVVLTAAIVGFGLAAFAVVSDGVNSSSNAVADDLAAIEPGENVAFLSPLELLQRNATAMNDNQIANAYSRRLDVDEFSDGRLRNNHRRWSNIAADPGHANHARSADMVAINAAALAERGLEPHSGY
ncbi:MAG: hypothetical protein AAGF68_10655 [Pseudomonadota bacterium]